MDDGNDVSNDYMQVAQARGQASTIENFLAGMERKKPAAETMTPAAEAATPAAPAASGGIMSKVGAVAQDFGKGVFMESPGAAASGVYDATHNAVSGAMHAWDSLAQWLNDNVANLGGEQPLGQSVIDAMPAKPPETAQTSTTGHMIREGFRFMTGFVPASRGLEAAGMGATGAAITGGGLSDFITRDPSQANISNLVANVPGLGPILAPLATNPHDPEILNRVRQGVEGLGFGAMTEGIVRGVRAMAAGKQAQTEMQAMEQKYGTVAPEEFHPLGNPDAAAPLVVTGRAADKLANAVQKTETGVPADVTAKGVAGSAEDQANSAGLSRLLGTDYGKGAVEGEKPIYMNFAKINTPDDVQAVIKDISKAFKGDIDEARRGVMTNDQTKALADQIGMTPEDLLSRRAGQPMSAEEGLAARRLMNTSAAKLLELAQSAAGPNAGAVDLYNFRKMLAIHQAVQSEVIAARTETARALQAWSIPAGAGGTEMARGVQQLMENMGGTEVSQELAKRFASLASEGVPPAALATAVRRGWGATSMDMVKESYVLGLLWNPATHFTNTLSNTAVAFQQIYERGIASRIGDFLGSSVDKRVVDGEAMAMTYGLLTSLGEAFKMSAKALRTGEGGNLVSKIDIPHEPAISSATVARELGKTASEVQAFAETPMGKALDLFGTITRAPGAALTAEDEFFKTIAYRAEVHAQALRQATSEGAQGPARWTRMAELANDPPEHIRLAAADAALYSTFQNKPGEWAQAMMDVRSSGSLNPTFLVLPFIKTPANIMRYTFERTPLAPLVKQWRDDIGAGGARRDLALARMSAGTAVMATGMDLASSGLITGAGPSDPAAREVLERQGWKPFSVYHDGQYYSYSRLDPFGMQLGFMATLAEKMKSKEMAGEDFDTLQEAMAAGIAATSQTIVDKSYFRGVAQVLDAIKSSEKSDDAAGKWFNRQTASLVPMSSVLNFGKRLTDPVQRDPSTTWEAVQAIIPGMSKELPPARDLWGAEKKPQEIYGRVFDVVSPVQVSKDVVSPVDSEMERIGASVDRIKKNGAFEGVPVSMSDYPEVYDYYVRLAGNELKHPAYGLGAKDYLDAVVSGKSPMSPAYAMMSDGPEGTKAAFISHTVSEFRGLARKQIMSEAPERFPEFASHIQDRQQELDTLKMPVIGGRPAAIAPQRPTPPPVQAPLPPRTNSSGEFQVPR